MSNIKATKTLAGHVKTAKRLAVLYGGSLPSATWLAIREAVVVSKSLAAHVLAAKRLAKKNGGIIPNAVTPDERATSASRCFPMNLLTAR